jgi:hypothetical protein
LVYVEEQAISRCCTRQTDGMNFLANLVMKLVIWLHALTKQDTTNEDAKKQPDLKRGLLDRVREHERELRKPSDLRPPR